MLLSMFVEYSRCKPLTLADMRIIDFWAILLYGVHYTRVESPRERSINTAKHVFVLQSISEYPPIHLEILAQQK